MEIQSLFLVVFDGVRSLEDLEKTKLEDELMEVICNGEEEITDS
ncbi:hypothetical protein [Nostoc sp.]